jgi:hypothetical protein
VDSPLAFVAIFSNRFVSLSLSRFADIQIFPERGGRSLGAPIRFYFRDGRVVNTDKCEEMLPDLESQHSDSSAFFSEVG